MLPSLKLESRSQTPVSPLSVTHSRAGSISDPEEHIHAELLNQAFREAIFKMRTNKMAVSESPAWTFSAEPTPTHAASLAGQTPTKTLAHLVIRRGTVVHTPPKPETQKARSEGKKRQFSFSSKSSSKSGGTPRSPALSIKGDKTPKEVASGRSTPLEPDQRLLAMHDVARQGSISLLSIKRLNVHIKRDSISEGELDLSLLADDLATPTSIASSVASSPMGKARSRSASLDEAAKQKNLSRHQRVSSMSAMALAPQEFSLGRSETDKTFLPANICFERIERVVQTYFSRVQPGEAGELAYALSLLALQQMKRENEVRLMSGLNPLFPPSDKDLNTSKRRESF